MKRLVRYSLLIAAAASTAVVFAAPASAKTYKVVSIGDIACRPGLPVTPTECRHAQVADRVAALKPDSLWLTGDVQYQSGELGNFQQSFNVSWGRFSKIWRPVPGNHEYFSNGAWGFFDFFGAAAGPGRRGFYSFRLGNWKVIALNTNCDKIRCDYSSAQNSWLRRELRRNRNKCVAAITHHPITSSGLHGANPLVAPLFKELRKARVDFITAGHEHNYERLAPVFEDGRLNRRKGIPTFIVGTGGRSLYEFGSIKSASAFRKSDAFGVAEFTLGKRGYKWRFVDEFGSSFDRGSARCR